LKRVMSIGRRRGRGRFMSGVFRVAVNHRSHSGLVLYNLNAIFTSRNLPASYFNLD
jgi:hypothetical protein